MRRVACRFQAQRHDEEVDAGHCRQEHICRRYGHGQNDEAADDAPRRTDDEDAVIFRQGLAAMPVIEKGDDRQTRSRPGDGTEGRAGSRPFQAFRQEEPGQDEHRADADELVRHLGKRRRRHLLQALEVAAEAAGDDRKGQGRRQDGQGRKSPGVADDAEMDHGLGAERQGQAAEDGDDRHEGQGHAEDAAHTAVMAAGCFFGNHDGDGNGDACADDAQEQDIDGIGHLIETDALAAEEARQEDAVQAAEDLDDDAGCRKDHGTAQKGVFTHGNSPFSRTQRP